MGIKLHQNKIVFVLDSLTLECFHFSRVCWESYVLQAVALSEQEGENLGGIVIQQAGVEGGRVEKGSRCQSHASMSLLQCVCSVTNAPFSPC